MHICLVGFGRKKKTKMAFSQDGRYLAVHFSREGNKSRKSLNVLDVNKLNVGPQADTLIWF